jgi:hypothetical protein
MCGAGYVCASTSSLAALQNQLETPANGWGTPAAPKPHEKGRCVRAPLDDNLFATCLPEMQPYEIHAGESFIIGGSASGMLTDLMPDPTTRECVVPPISSPYVRLHQPRLPVGAPALAWCPPSEDARHLHNPVAQPGDPTAVYDPLGPLDPSIPNVCLDPGPPGTCGSCAAPNVCFNGNCSVPCTPGAQPSGCPTAQLCLRRTDAPGGICLDPTVQRLIHYENPFFAIELQIPAGRALSPDNTDVKFVIVGGGYPLAVPLATDVTALQPRAIVTSPDLQTVFVVDEGKQSSGTGLRGQLLRVSTAAQATDRSFTVR